MAEWDYVIVGAGAAGSVLANRLSAAGGNRVVLIEAGEDLQPGREPADIRNIFPLSLFNDRYLWPDTFVHWRRHNTSPLVPLPQGRILGGSSAVMGMWAMRGHPHDYDDWAAAGAAGWGWAGVLPYFKRLENDVDFAGPAHGQIGPLPIRREAPEEWNAVARAVHTAASRRGWIDVDDMNADFRDGHCRMPISREERSRASAGLHYLTAEVRRRSNLAVITGHTVSRLRFAGRRVIGVEVDDPSGQRKIIDGNTIVLTAGALRTPELLMRSGIAAHAPLRDAGVNVVHDLPGVGANLQNHAVVYLTAMLESASIDPPGWRPAGSTVLRWTTGGPSTPPADMAIYIRSYLAWHALGRRMASLAPCLMRPASTGRITLNPVRPQGSPRIEFDMLSDQRDLGRLRQGFMLAADLFGDLVEQRVSQPPVVLARAAKLMRYNRLSNWNALRARLASSALTVAPVLGRAMLARLADMIPVSSLVRDEAALDEFIKNSITGTGHVCGTCRMGHPDDPQAVTDPKGNVIGLSGLMVGDASLMPYVPAGNTHVPVVMVAEKIAAGLTGDSPA